MSKRKLLFVGGIHGVGKTTMCRTACVDLGLVYLSAGELIKQNKARRAEVDLDLDKRVFDVNSNQDALTLELDSIARPGKSYLLDGHFTLFGSQDQVERVPPGVFQKIRPRALIVITDDPVEISKRLLARDARSYDPTLLARMQHTEIQHALSVAGTLRISSYRIAVADANAFRAAIASEIE